MEIPFTAADYFRIGGKRMSDSPNTQQKISREEALKYVHQDRRYVGSRETAAYIMYDASQSLNINIFRRTYCSHCLVF